MNYQAVIFDLDGTLLNTVEDVAFAMNKVLEKHNFPIHEIDDYRYFVGGGLAHLVYRTIPEQARTPELIKTYLNEVMDEYSLCMDSRTKPYPGINQILDELSAKNIALAILSNKEHKFMADIIKTHFAKWSFKAIFGSREGIPRKPNPQGAIEIAQIMQISPQLIAYVGDSDVDMQTATQAQMFPIGVTWGFRTEEELLTNGAKMIIQSPEELLTIF